MTMTIIPKKQPLKVDRDGTLIKQKVAAYARVSTDLEDQRNSFNAQLDEYQNRIKENPEWEFVGLYSDEGISGTSLKHREGFKKMVRDALAGKIDLILTKSISRFARNTVDCVKTYRELRAANVAIYFDKEHINSLEKDVEFQLTLYASMAQEESKSISQNVKWGVRSRMKRGDRKMNVKYTLGYRYNDFGEIEVIEEEARTVRDIFTWFIAGDSLTEIANKLKEHGCKKKTDSTDWKYIDVRRVLMDEKYIGLFVMQKTVVKDFLDHKAYKNDGIEEKYILENHHEPLIKKDNFDYVQMILHNPEFRESERADINPLNGIIYCGDCFLPLTKIKHHPGLSCERFVLTCRNIKKNSESYKTCYYKEGPTDFNLAVQALNDIFKRFSLKNSNFADFINENIEKSIQSVMEEKAYIDKEILYLQKRLQEVLSESLKSSKIDNSKEFNRINSQLNNEKTKLEKVNNAIMELRDLSVDSKINNDDKNLSVSNRLTKQYIKLVIRMHDGSLRFILRKEPLTIDEKTIKHYLKMSPTHSYSVSEGKRTLNYDVIMEEEQNAN